MFHLTVSSMFVLLIMLFACHNSFAQQEKVEEKEQEPVDWAGIFVMHYHSRVEQFGKENKDLEHSGYIIFVGDSITEGFQLEEYFPDKPVLNRGIGADGIGIDNERGVLNRLNESIFDCSPEQVFLLIGVNDLPAEEKTPEICLEKYRQIVEQIQQRSPKTNLVLQTLLPVGTNYQAHKFLNPRITEFNSGIRELAKEKGLTVLDLHAIYRDEEGLLPAKVSEDGLHLKPEAYQAWSDRARALFVPNQ